MRRKAEFEDGVGPVPSLASNETLVCRVGTCGARFAAGSPEIPTEALKGGVQCPTCEGWSGFWRETPTETIADRWPGCEEDGWWYMQTPRSLLRYAGRLGIKDGHVTVLLAIDSYQKTPDQPAYPDLPTLAAELGISDDTLSRRLNDLEKIGLIERERKKQWRYRITTHGLRRALAHIAANHRDGRPGDAGLGVLLAELAADSERRRKMRGRKTATCGDAPPQDAAAEVELVQVEQVQEELLTKREPEAPGEFLHEVVGGEEAMIFMLAAEFDAVEIDKDDDQGDEVLCAYPRHRRSDWFSHGGRHVCGVCHPPAAPALVARRAA